MLLSKDFTHATRMVEIKMQNLSQILKRVLPASLEPYFRLARYDKPIGSQLFFIPATWGLTLVSTTWYPDPVFLAGFYGLAIFTRGAMCVVNDLVDRDYDRKVERCKTRPIASGEIDTKQASICFIGNLAPCAFALAYANIVTQAGICALVSASCAYPLFKRITYWPQAWLGFFFNMGALIGYSAIAGTLSPAIIALYLGGWTQCIMYDSLYAYQDRKDDESAGVKSTALLWGEHYKEWSAMFSVFSALNWTAAGVIADLDVLYYVAVAGAFSHMVWQFTTVKINDPKDCFSKFCSNKYTGLLILAGIMGAKWQAHIREKSEKVDRSG